MSAAAASVWSSAQAASASELVKPWIATPPLGFEPLLRPGRVVKVTKGNDFASLMQPNQLWPRPEVAREMVERALVELSGKANLVQALGAFIHPQDKVALKVNGISGQTGYTMAFNAELVLPVLEGLIRLGVSPSNIHVFEQYPTFLKGTRLGLKGLELPKGVGSSYHANRDAVMPQLSVFNRTKTRFVRQVTDATAIIDMTMMKDHSICGFTGALKNMTHGQIINPEAHHAHRCDPQIPVLYKHPVLQSRVRLHLVDAFKIIYDQGPLDKNPARRIPHGAVYAATDPVALDTVGLRVIDEARRHNGLKSLAAVGRAASYIHTAAELGLGTTDWNFIQLREVTL